MDDKEQTTQKDPDSGKQPGDELVHELTELADRFANVVRVAWNSDQRKRIEDDVKSGLESLSASLEDGFRQVSASDEAKELKTKATEVGGKVSSSKIVADLADALKTGLRAISDQLDKLATDIQTKEAKPSGGGSGGFGGDEPAAPDVETKDIPIGKA